MENNTNINNVKYILKIIYALRDMGITFFNNHNNYSSISSSTMNNPIGTLTKNAVNELRTTIPECNKAIDTLGDKILSSLSDKPKTKGFVNIAFIIIIILLVIIAIMGGYLAAKYL